MKLKSPLTAIFRRSIIIFCAVFCLLAFVACSEDKRSTPSLSGVFAADVSVAYDGRPHSITVVNTIASDNVTYSIDGVSFTSVSPSFTEVGVYTVYYKVLRSGYPELSSSATVSISSIVLSGISAENISAVYDGLPHSISIQGTQDLDSLSYSTDGVSFSSVVPEFTEVGEYTVYYRVSRTYGEYKSSCTVSILPNIYGRYFNPSFGVISLSQHSAYVNSSTFPLSFSVSGAGYIGSDPFTVADGVLYYNDLSFNRLSDSNHAYKLSVANNSMYFSYSASGALSITFEDNIAEIALDDNVLLSVPNFNYCESGVITDYSPLCFEQLFSASSSSVITDISVELSYRADNPITVDSVYYTYDELPHGFDFSVPAVFPDYDAPPTFTEVGKHAVSVIFVSDTYLPKTLSCSIVILPDISGVYLSSDHVIQISDGVISFDGTHGGELTIFNDSWTWNGKAISVTENGIVYDGVAYTATTDIILVIYFNDELYSFISVPYSVDNVYISLVDSCLIFEHSETVQLTVPITQQSYTITINGNVLSPHTTIPNFYALGISDLNSVIVAVQIYG